MNSKRIAVIGSGISGLSAAWLLRDKARVTLYEADSRFGGHSNTLVIEEGDRPVPVDTGFMVFNRPNYPLLSRLFEQLGVETYPTDMSFSVSLDRGRVEYAGNNLDTLFAQRRNLVNPAFLRMLSDILRFNRAVKRLLASDEASGESLGRFLDRHRLGSRFRTQYLYPMAAAIWSCPRDAVAAFPVASFARFFDNHGLASLVDRPQWQTLVGGASSYVSRLVADLGENARAGRRVLDVTRRSDAMELRLDGGELARFDEVVFACHSDQALQLFSNPTPSERAMLGSVSYQANRVLLHSDRRLMPVRRKVWASWNYLGGQSGAGSQAVSVSYWMNALQKLDTTTDYFVSLNPGQEPEPAKVVAELEYHHPVFDSASLGLAHRLAKVQGRDRAWFAGAWTGYGFHEDGIRSGVEVALGLGASLPWESALQASHALTAIAPVLVPQAA